MDKKYTANNKEQFSYKYYSCTDSWTIRSIVILDKSISESSVQIVIAVLSAYVVCFLMLEILRRVYKHQREKLDDAEEEGKG